MKRPTVWDRLPKDALWGALVLALSAAKVGGLYAPWGLAAVAVCSGGRRGAWAAVGAFLGAVLFFDFQSGLRFAASAVLICCANLAFFGTRVRRLRWYVPLLPAAALLTVQSVYLVGRTASQWALCAAACAVAGAAAYALQRAEDERSFGLLAALLALTAALSGLTLDGFTPGGAAAVWLALCCAVAVPPTQAAALGAAAGLCVDLAPAAPVLLWTAICGGGGLCASLLRGRRRVLAAGVMCLWALAVPLALDGDRPWAVVYAAAAGAAAFLLMRRSWLPSGGGERAAVPAMAVKTASGAAAFRELYDTLFRSRPAEQGENPAVIFDHAAAQVCRDCLLVKRCWQAEYSDTFRAFNDACGPMLRRGRAEAADFPLFFTSRCLHFPALLAAINTEVYAFRLRRQYRARLEDVRALAEAQYDQLGEALGDVPPPEVPTGTLLRCRVGSLLRPREGETLCGDQTAVFTVGATLYMLLSDGMGSGPAAHAESAMTVRLLRQFLKAGIRPVPALKTINTALTLRCQEQGAFTTIDLVALDRRTGAATLYKYGAAASYVKTGGAVTAVEGGSLPAGLQPARQLPEATTVQLAPEGVLVMVSDGVTCEGDEWLRSLIAQWQGQDAQELAQLILAESRRHGGLGDDCAALVLRPEKAEENHEKYV